MDQMAVNIQEDGAVELLVDDVGLEDLVIERLRGPLGGRHFGCATQSRPAGWRQLIVETRAGEPRCETVTGESVVEWWSWSSLLGVYGLPGEPVAKKPRFE